MGFGDSANGGPFSSAWRATRERATGEEGSGTVEDVSVKVVGSTHALRIVVSALSYRRSCTPLSRLTLTLTLSSRLIAA